MQKQGRSSFLQKKTRLLLIGAHGAAAFTPWEQKVSGSFFKKPTPFLYRPHHRRLGQVSASTTLGINYVKNAI
jgi:hypothetical protein